MTQSKAAADSKNTITHRGIKLELPEDPGSDAGYMILNGEAQDAPGQFLGLVLGPEQYAKVQAKARKDKLSMRDAIEDAGELLQKILRDVYGIGSGE